MTSDVSYDRQRAAEAGVDLTHLPRHLAMIMDGNGRWAQAQGEARVFGHQQGVETVRQITTLCGHIGIERLTLYAFSSENWHRPSDEVAFLWDLLDHYLHAELATLMKHGVKLEVIGDMQRLPQRCQQSLHDTIAATSQNSNITVCMALSYGGQDELVRATRQIAREVAAGALAVDDITHERFAAALDHAMPVDLLVRTAGEQRVSNFLLWQCAYAEYVSTDCCWPEFDDDELFAVLREFQRRSRTYGKLPQQKQPDDQPAVPVKM